VAIVAPVSFRPSFACKREAAAPFTWTSYFFFSFATRQRTPTQYSSVYPDRQNVGCEPFALWADPRTVPVPRSTSLLCVPTGRRGANTRTRIRPWPVIPLIQASFTSVDRSVSSRFRDYHRRIDHFGGSRTTTSPPIYRTVPAARGRENCGVSDVSRDWMAGVFSVR